MEPLKRTDPKKIGPYRIGGLLGAGGMGRVYLGVDRKGNRAAVKVVNASLLRDAEFRKRFLREAAATAKVSGRFIAGIVASDLEASPPWLATRYIEGTALSDRVADPAHGPLTPADVQQLASGLAEALTAIHAAGVVHRDVKPANVLLAERDPYLIDFGIARDSAASTITRSGIVLGTPPYMAPEQIRGEGEVGPPADIFALGGVLTFAITGRHPFGEGDPTTLAYRIAHEEPNLDGVEDEVIRKLITACLAKDPAERPTARELQVRVASLATRPLEREAAAALPTSGEPSAEPELVAEPSDPEPAPQPAPSAASVSTGQAASRRARRSLTTAALTIAAVIVGAGILGVALAHDGSQGSGRSAASGHTSTVSSSPDSPTGSDTASSATTAASSSASGKPAPPPGAPSGKAPSPTGPGPDPSSGSANQPSISSAAHNSPDSVADSTATTLRTTSAPAPPRTSSSPAKPPTSNPPPRNVPPAAPTGATFTIGWADSSMNDYVVTFKWSTVTGATSYDLHYTFYNSDGRQTADQIYTGITDTKFQAPDEYSDPTNHACFVVRAVNAYGTSNWDSSNPHCS